ncbi:uncharacterized protein LOC129778225 [Toxorhynchites rutilus septentrionalis]|uniref:uncharacterized protein LOC129778225 n=1 Tax=Toxorhynchites rutilus septentrionalis TaxID=329112 RepID=UPI0024793763|nr:uncharacterized protein LOC129778225 [Toxorhynchites rutilus septentrionalis]
MAFTVDKIRLSTCFCLCFALLIISSQCRPTRPQEQETSFGNSSSNSTNNISKSNGSSLLPPIKKDVFMSRGWGASGMPFTMYYLNHYTKIQKAQNQQQQMQRSRQQEMDEIRLQPREENIGLDQPRTLPYGTRYGEPLANAQQGEVGRSVYKEDEYTDSSVYLPAKPSPPRRQYNIPQLFVSYGWGPMG